MNLPNFLIIGAAKSGTTSLYQYVRQHPDVYMPPVKEPGFFAYKGRQMKFTAPDGRVANEEGLPYNKFEPYTRLFESAESEMAVGEASTVYLYSERAPRLIKEYIPHTRLIAILRNPVDRAYSHFLMEKGRDQEPLSFEEALNQEKRRIEKGYGIEWRYKSYGYYCDQLKRYFRRFPNGQMKVFLFSDIKNRPVQTVKEVFKFLDVDTNFSPDIGQKHNVSSVPRSTSLYRTINSKSVLKKVVKKFLPRKIRGPIRKFVNSFNSCRPEMDDETRKKLSNLYYDQVRCLEDLINRNLGHWV